MFISRLPDPNLKRIITCLSRSVGHEERLRRHDHMPVRLAERGRPSGRARPSATAYVLLLALRLREEGKGKNFLDSLHADFGESTFYEVG